MKYEQSIIRRNFINRLKTQGRPYNKLGFHFLPKVYTKLCQKNEEYKNELNALYHQLYKTIKLDVNGQLYPVEDIENIIIDGNRVSVEIKGITGQINLENFEVKNTDLAEVSIDHTVSFHQIYEEQSNNLPTLKLISDNHNNGLPQDTVDLKEMIKEIKLLYDLCDLRLMPKHENISKGNTYVPKEMDSALFKENLKKGSIDVMPEDLFPNLAEDSKVGKLAQKIFSEKFGTFSKDLIIKLMNLDYCKEHFNAKYIVIKRYVTDNDRLDKRGKARYYSPKNFVLERTEEDGSVVEYLFTNDWYERQIPLLEKWAKQH